MKYRVRAIILMFFVFVASVVNAQNRNQYAKIAEIKNIDQSLIECIYEYSVTDSDLNQSRTYYDILQVGKTKSKYFSYKSYRTDSIVYKKDINKITRKEYETIIRSNSISMGSPYTIIKNKDSQIIDYYDRIFIDYYVIADSLNIMKWTLKNKSEIVCGYLCQIAETNFRGRYWTAYYAPDLPINDGPWKFSGLPGLILKVEDSDKEHIFNAITLRKSADEIYIEKKSYFKTNRKQFNQNLNKYKSNPSSFIAGSQLAPKKLSGEEKNHQNRKLFYKPIELD
ncbi:GLPGLI family protein [Dysgonomonas sp. PFB1-18]|uniref:GLPGLI family protein n=1 Tax=unclassified Dysgonomonas TaxID=2630389 RepID=UPI002474CF03|nr:MULTISPECIES: GLPGLI family protein [unclassified Dysgonomonas]MDH6307969.1 GLPGLI family protein [Dysgonomonas sp. PF1-14]MDH6339508.1 GLPGLI family protein [Dysgonomonas sp. PF1-16]MDH6381159.1 GLPGLI family protein [Dysgonomonas sp. PFB1-18]MDH6398371.1 GLPGLI family protein [Dysgonomonas sp. PF1-23]